MYIISKYKDYYDGVAGTMGIDKTIVYDRQIIDVEEKDMPEFLKPKRYYSYFRERENNPFYQLGNSRIKRKYWKKYPHDSYFIIGFCGKLYVGWKLYGIKENCEDHNNVNTTITYDLDYIK